MAPYGSTIQMRWHIKLWAAGLVLLLGGCITGGPTVRSPTNVPIEDRTSSNTTQKTDDQSTQAGGTAIAVEPTGKTQVTLALLEKSASARTAGNHRQAITYVERAIRINPRRADLWVQLAGLQLAIAKPSAAENYARKAITLAGTRQDWVRDAWLVIAQAKSAQGRSEEAAAIRQRWETARG